MSKSKAPKGSKSAKAKTAKAVPATKHKPNCPGLNQNVELVADHNRKMMVCRICAVPDSTPELAKNAYKLIEGITKAKKSLPAKAAKPKAPKPEVAAPAPETPAPEAASPATQ